MMTIDRLNGRPAIAIAAASLLLIVLVGWFGFVSPQRAKADSLAVQIGDTERQLAITEAVAREARLEENARLLATLRRAVPDEMGMPDIMRQLTRAATDGRVRITGITPAAVVSTGVADSVPITVTIEGRYFGIQEFLRRLRTRTDVEGERVRASGRLFSVDSIQFTGTEQNGRITATLVISAYAFREPVPTPGASTAVTTEPPAEAVGG
jgi:Tfp pilus assembly protein PilO